MNRPPVNALSAPLLRELVSQLEEQGRDADLSVVVLRGNGPKAFSAGADITEFPNIAGGAAVLRVEESGSLINAVERFPLPVIAAIHGYCLGGGFELAMACDIRVAAQSTQFGLPEINLGLIPGAGGTQRLPRLVPPGVARRLVYTGQAVGAGEAVALGIVDVLAKGDDPLPHALEMAERIAQQSPVALAAAKEALRAAQNESVTLGMGVEARAFARCLVSEDGREGVRAFLEKRCPVWTGR